MDFIWKSILMAISAFLLLRISGRKSIAQMTITTTVVMISIGSIIVQPIIEDSVTKTITTIATFIVVLVLIEYLQVKFNFLEKLFTGKSLPVIVNGQINHKNIQKMQQ